MAARSSDSILSFFCDLNYTHYGESNATRVSIVSRSVILFLVISMSFVENLLVFMVVFHPRPCLTKSQYFVVNMCVGNQLLTLFIMPFSAVTVINEKWVFGQIWCACTGFIFTVLINNLIFTTLVITAERLYAVMHPLSYTRHVSKRKYMGVIAGTWVGSFIFAFLPIVAGALSRAESLFQYHPSMYTCTLRIPANYFTYRLYLGIYICVTYILPLSFILMAYVRLFHAAHTSASRLRRHGCGGIPTFSSSSNKLTSTELHGNRDFSASSDNQLLDKETHIIENPLNASKPTKDYPVLHRSLTTTAVLREKRKSEKMPVIRSLSNRSCPDDMTSIAQTATDELEDRQNRVRGCFGSTMKNRTWSFRLNRRSLNLRSRVSQFVGRREELQAAKTALFIIGSFIICISPYFVVLIMDVIAGNDVHASTSTTRTIGIWSLFTLCAITPALYFYRNRHIRCLMKQMLGGSVASQADKQSSIY